MSDQEPSEPQSEITDYWALPKSGPKVTFLNSAWTWTGLIYLFILLAVVFAALQQGLALFNGGWMGLVIVVAMLYPAWRIGSLISRFMKKRGIGASFDTLFSKPALSDKDTQDSVKARMAERKARVEQARKDGKL